MKKNCLLLFLCLALTNYTFGESNYVVKSNMQTFTAAAAIIQTKQIEKSKADTVKTVGVKLKEVTEIKREKQSDAGDFEFLTNLPVMKTFISGIVSVVKGVSKLVN